MKLFWEITKLSFQRHLTYRAAAVAGLVTNFFFGILRAAIFIALFDLKTQVAGYTLKDAITYAVLGQALIGYLSLFHWFDLMTTVYTGDVGSDLLKPMGYFQFWLAQDFGRAGVQLILRGVTLVLAFAFVYDLIWPSGLINTLALAISILLSWLVSFSWRFLSNLISFWTPNARGILRLIFIFSWFFSGFLMPLEFFPKWLSDLSYWMPFRYMFSTVVEVYLGRFHGWNLVWALGQQALWAGGIILAGQIALRAGVRRLVILGG